MSDKAEHHKQVLSSWKFPIIIYSVFAVGFILYRNEKLWPVTWFMWHPILMIIAYVPLALNAILIKKVGGYQNTKTHGILMFLSTLLTIGSLYVIYTNKAKYNKPHFTSWHGLVGIIDLGIFYVVQYVGFLGLHPDFGFLRTNKTVRFLHKWAGKAALTIGLFSMIMGFRQLERSLIIQVLFSIPLLFFGYFTLFVLN